MVIDNGIKTTAGVVKVILKQNLIHTPSITKKEVNTTSKWLLKQNIMSLFILKGPKLSVDQPSSGNYYIYYAKQVFKNHLLVVFTSFFVILGV